MTKAWVVYESMFGNTHRVASVIAEELGTVAQVELHEVSDAKPLPPDLDLLVVGAPTHALSLSRPSTREDARQKTGHTVESASMGVREWLDALSPSAAGPAFATFDTKVSHPRITGSAAKKAAKKLRKLGFAEAVRPATFWVRDMEGPLEEGELQRTRSWARALGDAPAGPGVRQPVG